MRATRPFTFLLVIAFALSACTTDADQDGADTTAPDETTTTQAAPTTAAAAEEADVAMQNTSFQPAEITVPVGTTVTWANQDGFAHTTTADDGLWDSGEMAGGATFSHTFEEPGTYTYLCEIHPDQMLGTVVVEG
jgi:plastocyanin